ncbi:hypothetical protein CRYUN_Cryun28dG0052300 [Craigia yunnanensis]
MEHFQNGDLEYVVDDYYDVNDFELDDSFAEPERQRDTADFDSFDSDFEDDFESNKPKTDTTTVEARNGKDIQGIPWERLNFSRDKYRETRLRQYKNYENLCGSREEMEKECLNVEKGKAFYDTFSLTLSLLNRQLCTFRQELLNVANPIVPCLKRPGLLSQQLSRVQISNMAVKENLMVAGGFQWEFICKYLNQPGVAFCTKLTTDDNAITNVVDVYRTTSGAMRVMAANNDAQTFASLNRFSFNWSVNNTSVSPDGKLLAVLGDSVECLIANA